MSAIDPFFSPANLLSLARVPLGILFGGVLVAPGGGPRVALGVLALAGLTDALDGFVARRGQARRLGGGRAAAETPAGSGSWLDPLCDKVFVAMVLGAIWVHSRPSLDLVALILARELAQLPLSAVYLAVPSLRHWLRYDFRASLIGKVATVSQFLAITAVLFDSSAASAAALGACLFGLLAVAGYLERAIRLGRRRRREAAVASAAAAASVASRNRLEVGSPGPDGDARASSSMLRG